MTTTDKRRLAESFRDGLVLAVFGRVVVVACPGRRGRAPLAPRLMT